MLKRNLPYSVDCTDMFKDVHTVQSPTDQPPPQLKKKRRNFNPDAFSRAIERAVMMNNLKKMRASVFNQRVENALAVVSVLDTERRSKTLLAEHKKREALERAASAISLKSAKAASFSQKVVSARASSSEEKKMKSKALKKKTAQARSRAQKINRERAARAARSSNRSPPPATVAAASAEVEFEARKRDALFQSAIDRAAQQTKMRQERAHEFNKRVDAVAAERVKAASPNTVSTQTPGSPVSEARSIAQKAAARAAEANSKVDAVRERRAREIDTARRKLEQKAEKAEEARKRVLSKKVSVARASAAPKKG